MPLITTAVIAPIKGAPATRRRRDVGALGAQDKTDLGLQPPLTLHRALPGAEHALLHTAEALGIVWGTAFAAT